MALQERPIEMNAAATDDGRAEIEGNSGSGAVQRREVAALNALLSNAGPEEVIAAALRTAGPGHFALVSSFGTESAVLLAAMAEIDRAIPVLFVDTGYHFSETLAYRDQLQARLRLTDIRSLIPDGAEAAAEDPDSDLFLRDPDACCALRKVRPLGRALDGFDAWANGRKRYQSTGRGSIPIVEPDGARLKFNPLVNLSRADIVGRFRALGLPFHPLEKFGFASIGCMPCTSRVQPGEDPRAGRWRGRGKIECGIHTSAAAPATR